jgi:hypothetical protein
VVAVLPDIDRRRLLEAELRPVTETSADFRNLAEWTGGTFSTAAFLQEAPLVAATLLAELRHQYVIAIEAVNAREWRALQVRVSKSSHVVRARSGYFGGETRGS